MGARRRLAATGVALILEAAIGAPSIKRPRWVGSKLRNCVVRECPKPLCGVRRVGLAVE